MIHITDEAIEAALDSIEQQGVIQWDTVRAALAAALPHLEGGTPSRYRLAWLSARRRAALAAFGYSGEGATPAIDRGALALAHHRFYCHTRDPKCSEVDEGDYDFADFALALIGGAS